MHMAVKNIYIIKLMYGIQLSDLIIGEVLIIEVAVSILFKHQWHNLK